MSHEPTIVIVGSGPIGSAYARVLVEGLPDAHVVMFEAGPQLTPIPGESVRNIADPDEKERAREMSQGPQAGSLRESLGIPAGVVVEGMFTARQGTHLLDFGGEGSASAPTFPAAAAATNVGGQGAHWTCATPSPAFSEKIPFIADAEWEDLLATAKDLLHVQSAAFADSAVGEGIRALLEEDYAGQLPEGYGPSTLPVAGDPQPDGTMRWAGADVVLGPLIDPASPLSERFELHDLSLVRRVEVEDGRAIGVTVEDLRTRESRFVPADLVVVAADAFRSPQLLWASGIRPKALGHYLTEHPVVISTVALDADKIGRFATEDDLDAEIARRAVNPADPVAAVNRIPFSEPDHPFSLQVMYAEDPPFPLDPSHPAAGNRWGYVNMGYGMRKRPRFEDGVTFSDDELDYRGFPNMTIQYELTDAENAEIAAATERLRRAGNALGVFIAEPRLLPNGSSLHYMGTTRIGETDDGTSVADPWSRVWGVDGLFVGGNGTIPTANAMNPTLMSVAVAVRGARKAVEELAQVAEGSATSAGTDDAALRERNRAVVHAFFTSNLDNPQERIALWHPDGVKELPFAPAGMPKTRWEGRDEIVANTLANKGMFEDVVHRDLVIHACEDPSLFFVTSRMVDGARFLGEPYPQSFVHLIRVQDGAVILQQEYFNSEILAEAERTARAKGRTPIGS